MEIVSNTNPHRMSAAEALPGTEPGSDIRQIYDYLARGDRKSVASGRRVP